MNFPTFCPLSVGEFGSPRKDFPESWSITRRKLSQARRDSWTDATTSTDKTNATIETTELKSNHAALPRTSQPICHDHKNNKEEYLFNDAPAAPTIPPPIRTCSDACSTTNNDSAISFFEKLLQGCPDDSPTGAPLPTTPGVAQYQKNHFFSRNSAETFSAHDGITGESFEASDGHNPQHLLSPPHRPDHMRMAQEALEEARRVKARYQDEIQRALQELEFLHLQNEKQRYSQKFDERDILLQYMPDHPIHSYGHILGPMLPNLVETSHQVGTYDIEACIGEGGFGQVFAGRDRRNDDGSSASSSSSSSKYALKKMHKISLLDTKSLDRLLNELRVLCMADHPNLVHCRQVLNARDHIYVVMNLAKMDLFSYRDLYDTQEFMATTATATATATTSGGAIVQIAKGLFRGLDYLHSKLGVAHLDIKPENLLVTENVPPHLLRADHVQLCDFGMCAIAALPSPSPWSPRQQHDPHCDDIVVLDDDPWTASSTTKTLAPIEVLGARGTYGFMAPEMLLFGVSEGRMADMWSAGATLLQLVAGRLPFGWDEAYHPSMPHDECSAILLECLKRVHEDPRYNMFISDPIIHDIITRLLQWSPENRLEASMALKLLQLYYHDEAEQIM